MSIVRREARKIHENCSVSFELFALTVLCARAVTANTEYGLHGYDNNVDSMRPLFMARGPSFRKAAVIDTEFQNIDLFSLFCRLLGIDAIAIDGDDPTHVWNGMLRANVTATEPVNAEMQPQCC